MMSGGVVAAKPSQARNAASRRRGIRRERPTAVVLLQNQQTLPIADDRVHERSLFFLLLSR
jgi:hypothetical protein